jgi:addiction module HigA family antidote
MRSKSLITTADVDLSILLPTHREPTHPGEMLLEEFLKPMGITQRELAKGIGVPYQRVNEIINGRRGVTASTALRLSRYLGMSVEFWLNGQLQWDVWHALRAEQKEIRRIKPVKQRRSADAPDTRASRAS